MVPFRIPALEKVLVKIGEAGQVLAPSSELNIFVWNVYKGQKEHLFENDFRKHGSGKDFILLQEALVDNKMPLLWKQDFASYEWHLAQSFHYKKNENSTGVAIGSKYTPSTVDFIRASARELFWLTPKLTLFSEYDFEGKKVLVVCTHVLNFVTTSAFTTSLYEIAERISKFEGPVILAGDFNTWNVKRHLIMKSIFRDLGLDHLDLENDGRLLKLDHVFVRGFEVLKAEVHHTVVSSDHFPLEIKLKL
ncbi:endonuclease/exonuclease/phosphatase family protein [Bdellovibrio sp. SKB1291214]|uniref:endonuclease/exonuclease/phosphatase family protein n=1 Tax=Bdellovibrio sp. SKB1291214 TaxID=1732569 RepID=UPI000B516B0F|nr:endonuclease/exonuclease/phosphatase family protein [Bdellovibrio sp. SKB1291214]UYL08280.1 endonuclease/exonuclease/phosphatase family protein [Bdellovibrio sp. SKB1291214]